MNFLVLNQYREKSLYKDEVGALYHFPKRYLKPISLPNAHLVYYEPRDGGSQVYFGCARIGEIWVDPENKGARYAEILDYTPFSALLSYWDPNGVGREPARTMRNSVRRISEATFDSLLRTGGVRGKKSETKYADGRELEELYVDAKPEAKRVLARRYERPNAITKAVKQSLGTTCQICSLPGFLMRNGRTYCEVHHLFHLAKELPGTLTPKHLIVVCANCHRKLHYSETTDPIERNGQWLFSVAGQEVRIAVFRR